MVKDTPVLSITHRVRTDISRVLNSSAPRAMPRNVTGEKKKKKRRKKKNIFHVDSARSAPQRPIPESHSSNRYDSTAQRVKYQIITVGDFVWRSAARKKNVYERATRDDDAASPWRSCFTRDRLKKFQFVNEHSHRARAV